MSCCFSSLFSKVTHVANGYHEDIFARVYVGKRKKIKDQLDGKTTTVEGETAKVEAKVSKEFVIANDYTRIGPGYFLKFYTDGPLSATVYVSIALKSSTEEFMCKNHPIKVNRSVIVDEKGYLLMAKYSVGPFGESSIWEDENGKNHEPKSVQLNRQISCEYLIDN